MRCNALGWQWSVAVQQTLEKGRFSWPVASGDQIQVQMSSEELTLLISGIELNQTSKKESYRREIGAENTKFR